MPQVSPSNTGLPLIKNVSTCEVRSDAITHRLEYEGDALLAGNDPKPGEVRICRAARAPVVKLVLVQHT